MTELSLIAKVTLVLLASLAAVRVAARASASLRSLILTAAFCVLLALPVVSLALSSMAVPVPVMPAPVAVPRGCTTRAARNSDRLLVTRRVAGWLTRAVLPDRRRDAACTLDASHSSPLDRPRRARRRSRSRRRCLPIDRDTPARRRACAAHDGDGAAGNRAAGRRTDVGRERPPSCSRPRDRTHSAQRLDRPHAGARRLR